MTDLIKEVKEALQAATPGPWEEWEDAVRNPAGASGSAKWICQMYDWNRIDYPNAEKNIHLIANSPTWLQQLIDRIETAERQREEANQAILKTVGDLMFVPAEIEKLKNQLAAAVKALEWYGDKTVYFNREDEAIKPIVKDFGELARTTLKRIKGENG